MRDFCCIKVMRDLKKSELTPRTIERRREKERENHEFHKWRRERKRRKEEEREESARTASGERRLVLRERAHRERSQ